MRSVRKARLFAARQQFVALFISQLKPVRKVVHNIADAHLALGGAFEASSLPKTLLKIRRLFLPCTGPPQLEALVIECSHILGIEPFRARDVKTLWYVS